MSDDNIYWIGSDIPLFFLVISNLYFLIILIHFY